ncbi:hypothetical protein [Solimonas soli]|uniref:hypothetical protein n=1 Tax=Solimonas soli TaxID=413479 RepID=UPI000480D0E5|nr:hypothetical protein [Solimonas soli]
MDACLFRAPLLAALVLTAAAAAAQPDEAATAPATRAPAAPSPADRAREISRIRGERGIDVCRLSADGTRKYQGITQGYERGQVQILVRVLDARTGEAVPGVRETNVWDDPANWSICAP